MSENVVYESIATPAGVALHDQDLFHYCITDRTRHTSLGIAVFIFQL